MNKDNKLFRGTLAGTLLSSALAGFNYLSQEAAEPPRSVLGGEANRYPWRLGSIAYHVAGPEGGEPLLLVHGVHAAASNYEFRRNFDFFAEKGYRVYAPDLLGFGQSDHPAMAYNDEVYIALLSDFARDVIGQATNVIASSLSCSFIIAAAARHAERFAKLVLIEPVGVQQLRGKWPVVGDLFYAFVRTSLFGEGFFNLLTSTPSLRYFLRDMGYSDKSLITDEMIEYHYNITHQPNARFAPGAFVSGALNRDVREEWARLQNPLLLVWGYQATTTPVQNGTEFLRLNPRAAIDGYDANLLPHDEQAARFNSNTLAWLEGRRKD